MCILTNYEVVYTENMVAVSLNLTIIVLISQKVKVMILFRQSLLLGTTCDSWCVCQLACVHAIALRSSLYKFRTACQ